MFRPLSDDQLVTLMHSIDSFNIKKEERSPIRTAYDVYIQLHKNYKNKVLKYWESRFKNIKRRAFWELEQEFRFCTERKILNQLFTMNSSIGNNVQESYQDKNDTYMEHRCFLMPSSIRSIKKVLNGFMLDQSKILITLGLFIT